MSMTPERIERLRELREASEQSNAGPVKVPTPEFEMYRSALLDAAPALLDQAERANQLELDILEILDPEEAELLADTMRRVMKRIAQAENLLARAHGYTDVGDPNCSLSDDIDHFLKEKTNEN